MKALMIIGLAALLCAGCATEYGTATPGFWAPALQTDPEARFGILIEQTKPVGSAEEVEAGK